MTTATIDAATLAAGPRVKPAAHWHDRLAQGLLLLVCAILIVFLLAPLFMILVKSVQDKDGAFVGLQQFTEYFQTASLQQSILHTISIAAAVTSITIPLAFTFAYALTRSCMPLKATFRVIALTPILAPSLLAAISFIQWFGTQGLLKGLLGGAKIYGPIGIVIGEVFCAFPHALIIVTTALAIADARQYEAAQSLKAGEWRIFCTVTLPGIRYGLISAIFVVFVLVITDFGVPKVIGEQYNVLATDIYKQVIGQQNFQMGAVVGLVLLTPARDRLLHRSHCAAAPDAPLLSARAVPLIPKPNQTVDWAFFAICSVIAAMILIVLGVAFIASIAKFWPYDLTPSLKNYNFDMMDGGGWESYRNSLTMSALTAVLGTAIIFTGAYLLEKTTRFAVPRSIVRFLTLLPLAVPGLVLGLGFIFFFNDKHNPLNFIYGTMAILVLCTIGHFYSVAHLTATTALKQIDPEFETVSSSLKVPIYKTFFRDIVPCACRRCSTSPLSLRQRDDHDLRRRVPLFAEDDARLARGAEHGRCR